MIGRLSMDYERFFPPEVRAALGYETPGAWMPVLPRECIRLSAGYPFPQSVPARDLVRVARQLVEEEDDLPLHYLGSPSMAALPEQIRARMTARGMALETGEVLVTAGACQAMDLAARALLKPDSLVAVEAPTYMEALEVFRNYTPYITGYPVDSDGLKVDALAGDLENRRSSGRPLPRLLYTIASYQNPTGACLSLPRRRELLRLSEEYDFLILEDDAYGELGFGEPVMSLKSLDYRGRVIHVGSLSKVVAPGLRIGWAAAPLPLIAAMSLFKKDLDHSFSWALASRYLAALDLEARVNQLRAQYRDRRDVMLASLRRYLPGGVTWDEPHGGFFVWLRVPGIDTGALLPRALEAGVSFIPGQHFFFCNGEGREFLRLSFSYLPPEKMEEGVAILGRLLRAGG